MVLAGIPLTVQSSGGRSTSRASSQRTFVSSYSRRISSSQGYGYQQHGYQQSGRGVLVSASRAGAARAAAILLISCHVADDEGARMAGAQSPEDDPTPAAGDVPRARSSLCAVLCVLCSVSRPVCYGACATCVSDGLAVAPLRRARHPLVHLPWLDIVQTHHHYLPLHCTVRTKLFQPIYLGIITRIPSNIPQI